ncbi:MAG TPA: DUF5654 family protein [Candidatus Paceibacterota bacterium]|nr:DUF5654 family protein [Candidatus Paceibacterota bacterium]
MIDLEKKKEIKKQIRSQTAGYLTGALGLVVGLAWSDAIKALIAMLFPFAKNGIIAMFVYAVVLTVAVVIIGGYLLKPTPEESEKKEGDKSVKK